MHSSRLDQGVVGPVAVPNSLERKRADLTVGAGDCGISSCMMIFRHMGKLSLS